MTVRVESFDHARDLLERAGGFLRERELERNLELAICEGLARESEPETERPLLVVAADASRTLGVALMRAGQPLVLTDLPEAAAAAVFDHVRARDVPVRELHAPESCHGWLATLLEQRGLGRFERRRTLLIYALDSAALLASPAAPGRARPAEDGDRALIAAWAAAFAEQTGFTIGVPEEFARARVAAHRAYVYELESKLVSLACIGGQARGLSRIGPVYTPPEQRRRGYGAALVSWLTRAILERGDKACLFADAANPESNRVYLGLGYREVGRVGIYERRTP